MLKRSSVVLCLVGVIAGVAYWSGCLPSKSASTRLQNEGGATGAGALAPDTEILPEVKALNDLLYAVGDQQGGKGVLPALEQLQKLRTQEGQKTRAADLYYALALPIRELDGIVWRLGDLARESDPLYAGLVGLVRGINYRSHTYGDHIYQLLVYLTRPQAAEDHQRFRNVSEIQDWAQKRLKPALQESLTILTELSAAQNSDKVKFLIDQKLFSGIKVEGRPVRFISQANEFRTLVPYHVQYLVALYERALSQTDALCAYQADELPYFINELAKMSLKNGLSRVSTLLGRDFFGRNHNDPTSAMKLLTPADFARVVRMPQFERLGVLKQGGKELLAESLAHLSRSLAAEDVAAKAYIEHGLSLDKLGERKFDEAKRFIWNPLEILVKKDDIVQALADRQALLSGQKTTHTSRVTGATFKISPRALFAGIPDLKSLVPNSFEADANAEYEQARIDDAHHGTVLIYNKGKPAGWPDPTFAGTFPDLGGGAGAAVKERMREVSLDFSTSVFAMVLPVPSIYSVP